VDLPYLVSKILTTYIFRPCGRVVYFRCLWWIQFRTLGFLLVFIVPRVNINAPSCAGYRTNGRTDSSIT